MESPKRSTMDNLKSNRGTRSSRRHKSKIDYQEMSVQIGDITLYVPTGLKQLIENLTREILKDEPRNIPRYAANYCKALLGAREERERQKKLEETELSKKAIDVEIPLTSDKSGDSDVDERGRRGDSAATLTTASSKSRRKSSTKFDKKKSSVSLRTSSKSAIKASKSDISEQSTNDTENLTKSSNQLSPNAIKHDISVTSTQSTDKDMDHHEILSTATSMTGSGSESMNRSSLKRSRSAVSETVSFADESEPTKSDEGKLPLDNVGKDIRRKASGERKSVKSIIRVNVFHADEDDDEGQDEAARTSTSASSMTQSEATTKFTQKESTAISRTSSFVDETSKSDASKSEGDSTEKLSTGTSLGETVKASVIDQHDDSRVYMHEQSWTAPTVAVSTASSRTESETSTKSALKESRATSETSSFVDDMKSDAGMQEKKITPEVTVSTASSRADSEAMTKSAHRESKATSETSSFVDETKSDAGVEEKTRTPEIAISTASSRTSSDAMTKSAQKESRATSETSSFVDDKEESKSDVDEMSAMDKSEKEKLLPSDEEMIKSTTSDQYDDSGAYINKKTLITPTAVSTASSRTETEAVVKSIQKESPAILDTLSSADEKEPLNSDLDEASVNNSENETLKKSRTGSPCNQSDSDDIDLNEKSRTSPRTVSVASSRTESKSITKSAKKEISAILDTTSSADEKESLKSDVDDASEDKDENKTLRKSRAGSSNSPRDQSDYDDVDLDEKSRTSPRAESAALSNTESRSSTKSAQKESQAVLDTISSADEREPLKSDVDEASVDNTETEQLERAASGHCDDIVGDKSWTTPAAVSIASSKTESEALTKSAQKECPAVLDTISSADEKEPLKSDVDEVSVDDIENEQLGMAKSDHYDDSGMHETSWTTPVAVSSASSKTESETMTKLAQRENPAILDTINSADEKEPLKLEVHEVSVDNSDNQAQNTADEDAVKAFTSDLSDNNDLDIDDKTPAHAVAASAASSLTGSEIMTRFSQKKSIAILGTVSSDDEDVPLRSNLNEEAIDASLSGRYSRKFSSESRVSQTSSSKHTNDEYLYPYSRSSRNFVNEPFVEDDTVTRRFSRIYSQSDKLDALKEAEDYTETPEENEDCEKEEAQKSDQYEDDFNSDDDEDDKQTRLGTAATVENLELEEVENVRLHRSEILKHKVDEEMRETDDEIQRTRYSESTIASERYYETTRSGIGARDSLETPRESRADDLEKERDSYIRRTMQKNLDPDATIKDDLNGKISLTTADEFDDWDAKVNDIQSLDESLKDFFNDDDVED